MSEHPDLGLIMKYFVLKPHGTSPYHRASRAAMRAYAHAIEEGDSRLADDLLTWVKREETLAKINAESVTVVEEGERFALPFWVDDVTWIYARMKNQKRTQGDFVHYLLHVQTGLEAHSDEQMSPYMACVKLREMIEWGENPDAKT